MAAQTTGSTDPAVPVADRRGILPAHHVSASLLDSSSDDHLHVTISEPRHQRTEDLDNGSEMRYSPMLSVVTCLMFQN